MTAMVEALVYMAPDNGAYLWMAINELEEFRRIVHGHAVEPAG